MKLKTSLSLVILILVGITFSAPQQFTSGTKNYFVWNDSDLKMDWVTTQEFITFVQFSGGGQTHAFYIDTRSDGGKELLSTILTAKSTTAPVHIRYEVASGYYVLGDNLTAHHLVSNRLISISLL